MHIQGMSTCAVQEIVSMSLVKGAKEQMRQFCLQTIGSKLQLGAKKNSNNGMYSAGLGETYIFHGQESEDGIAPPGAGIYAARGNYCFQFAAFIAENGLGQTVRGKAVFNSRYHPDHTCVTYIWNPDMAAVQTWWKAEQLVMQAEYENEGKNNPVAAMGQILAQPQAGRVVIEGNGGIVAAAQGQVFNQGFYARQE